MGNWTAIASQNINGAAQEISPFGLLLIPVHSCGNQSAYTYTIQLIDYISLYFFLGEIKVREISTKELLWSISDKRKIIFVPDETLGYLVYGD